MKKRIKKVEKEYSFGTKTEYYPQVKKFGVWHYVNGTRSSILFPELYFNIRNAKQAIKEYVQKKEKPKKTVKIIYL